MDSKQKRGKQAMASKSQEKTTNQMSKAFLVIQNQVFPLTREVTLIGRRLTNHLVVDDRRVSRMHAQIRSINNQFLLVDLNSTGGTFVNGEKIYLIALYSGDLISLAGIPISFIQDSIELENESEDYTFPNIPIEKQEQITERKRKTDNN